MTKRLTKSLLILTALSVLSAFTIIEIVQWDRTDYDFGKIIKNQPVTGVFTLTNTSTNPLIITSVKGSCGCTATKYEKDPIPAGNSSSIEATYNAKKLGVFKKTVTVTTNQSDESVTLTLSGEVIDEY